MSPSKKLILDHATLRFFCDSWHPVKRLSNRYRFPNFTQKDRLYLYMRCRGRLWRKWSRAAGKRLWLRTPFCNEYSRTSHELHWSHAVKPWLHVQLLHATRCNFCMQ